MFDFRSFRNALVRSAEFSSRQVAAIETAIEEATQPSSRRSITAGDIYTSSGGVRLIVWNSATCVWQLVSLAQFEKSGGGTSGPEPGVTIKRSFASVQALRYYLDEKEYQYYGCAIGSFYKNLTHGQMGGV